MHKNKWWYDFARGSLGWDIAEYIGYVVIVCVAVPALIGYAIATFSLFLAWAVFAAIIAGHALWFFKLRHVIVNNYFLHGAHWAAPQVYDKFNKLPDEIKADYPDFITALRQIESYDECMEMLRVLDDLLDAHMNQRRALKEQGRDRFELNDVAERMKNHAQITSDVTRQIDGIGT